MPDSPRQADEARYRVRNVGLIHWKELDQGWAGYTEQTGQTFVIDPLSRFLWDCIESADCGCTSTELCAQVHSVADDTPESELPGRVDTAIGILSRAELIETAPLEPLPSD